MAEPTDPLQEMMLLHQRLRDWINTPECTEFEWPERLHPAQIGLHMVVVDEIGRFWRVEETPEIPMRLKMIFDPKQRNR